MPEEVAPSPEVELDEFHAAHAGGATVLDVRRPDEYEERHVPGAVLIPLDELGARIDEVPDADRLYVICKVGGRSLVAAKALNEAGRNAVSVKGGTDAWADAGHPVRTGATP